MSFATLQEYFRTLEEHVRKLTPADLAAAADEVRLMEYNNDASKHLADVRTLFAAALARMR